MQLTRSLKADAQTRWSPDGTTIAFISARDDRPQVFTINPFGGEAEKRSESRIAVTGLQRRLRS